MSQKIVVRNAQEHNLKGIDIDIPRDSMVVVTGVSGSGKSSLAFDTLFQEGQRKYIESLSAYARQFIGTMKTPKVERIEGISPTISIDQKTVNRNPRSTVGTITEIWDHLRLLFARLGIPHCPSCGDLIQAQTVSQITDGLLVDYYDAKLIIMAPIVRERKGEYRKELSELQQAGFVRARIDGEMRELDEDIVLARYEKHSIDVVVDRLVIEDKTLPRIRESIEAALKQSVDLVSFMINDEYMLQGTSLSCSKCRVTIPEIEPRLFSFNDPQGQCSSCTGLGFIQDFEIELLIPDPSLSIEQGCIKAQMAEGHLMFSRYGMQEFKILAKEYGFQLNVPWNKMSKKAKHILMYGSEDELKFKLKRRGRRGLKIKDEHRRVRGFLEVLQRVWNQWHIPMMNKYMRRIDCDTCHGDKLNTAAMAVLFEGNNIQELSRLGVSDARKLFDQFPRNPREEKIGGELFSEIQSRLSYLDEVGLGYLTLDRAANTLSGGESQRIRLASQVGAGLQGVTYILDEPSIGLHPRDNEKLLEILQRLKNLGNTLIVVEHDEDTMLQADQVIDIGPGAGVEGGEILASGSLKSIVNNKKSITGAYLSGREKIEVPSIRRELSADSIKVIGACENNLKNIDVEFPLGGMVTLTGVSGSGKSTLMNQILKKSLAQTLHGAEDVPGAHQKIEGVGFIDKVIEIDQSAIGRTPRSNPATYTKIWDEIRNLFAQLTESQVRGYSKGRFSFNVNGGRCEECEGAGVNVIEMQLLENVQVPCESCNGKRFNPATLEIHFKGKTISDILGMSVSIALEFFKAHPKIYRGLKILEDIGLGYLELGQPSTTLSGGEAQRMKIASELKKPEKGHTLYLLDEPTTGLHFHDIKRLISCMNTLVDRQNSMIVIEHNLDVVKVSDWVIDMGPDGGDGGGELVFCGRPEDLAKCKKSDTGRYLKPLLNPKRNPSEELFTSKSYLETQKRLKEKSKEKVDLDILIQGAKKHNLKNIDVRIPRHKLTVLTGVSGSGKSSLAFHTLFAEGQRRFVESMSTYARRFLGQMDRGGVEAIQGLAPSIAIDQSSTNRSPRSTVATITELYDYFRLLFSRIGRPHSPASGGLMVRYSHLDLYKKVLRENEGENLFIMAPVLHPRINLNLIAKDPANLKALVSRFLELGYRRLWDGSRWIILDEDTKLPSLQQAWLLIDRVKVGSKNRARIIESFEQAEEYGHGLIACSAGNPEDGLPISIYSNFYGNNDDLYFFDGELEPKHFSFNSHWGACIVCTGLGFVGSKVCPSCDGDRLKPEYSAVLVGGINVTELSRMSIATLLQFFKDLELSKTENLIVKQLLKEVMGRLEFLVKVGLDYIQLDRRGDTLSGGEAQRIRLASQIGSGLEGVLYVLDEPTVGLHQKDTDLLLQTLFQLRNLGNTVVVVEHDLEFIRHSDHLIELGPGAGDLGGELIAEGTPKQLARKKKSLTGQYLSGKKQLGLGYGAEVEQIEMVDSWVTWNQINFRSLKNFDLKIPQGALTVVTGVSGSGKSTLIEECLYPLAYAKINRKRKPNKEFGDISWDSEFKQVQLIDQSPIGKSPRSTPITYTKTFDLVRDLYASLNESKIKGYNKGRFSFNKAEGRCAECEGKGSHYIEMHFLSDVWELCESCQGQRYNQDTLAIKFKGKSIADVMSMRINEAVEFFESQPKIVKTLKTFKEIGLGYLKLGQPANTLSGGEAQRLKLAAELAKAGRSQGLFLLDEPTTGLHMDDIQRLWALLRRLVSQGHTVVLIEHHPEVIAKSDWVIDLGPVGGDLGGELLFSGWSKDLLKLKKNETTQAVLKAMTHM